MAFTFTHRGHGLFFKMEVQGETQVSGALIGILKRVKDLRPLANPYDWIIRADIQENFGKDGGGRLKWIDLTPSTVAQRIRHGYPGQHPILVQSGRLKSSLLQKGHGEHILKKSKDCIEIGTEVPYAKWHQSPQAKKRRPLIYITGKTVNRLVQATRQFILDNKIFRR